MIAHHTPKYNAALDEEIMSLGGVPNGEGEILDIHETLFYSKSESFYILSKIRQALRGRTWDTLEFGEYDYTTSSEEVRFLKVYRPMTRAQVMRFLIEAYMPVTEGIRILLAAGVGSRAAAPETTADSGGTTVARDASALHCILLLSDNSIIFEYILSHEFFKSLINGAPPLTLRRPPGTRSEPSHATGDRVSSIRRHPLLPGDYGHPPQGCPPRRPHADPQVDQVPNGECRDPSAGAEARGAPDPAGAGPEDPLVFKGDRRQQGHLHGRGPGGLVHRGHDEAEEGALL